MFNKTIITEFFTTVSFTIFLRTIGILTYKLPFLRYGDDIDYVEYELLSYIGNINSKIISFYNGRSAIYHSLKMIRIKKNDEVIVSGYTCISVSNAVIQSGAKIVYSDIDSKNLGLNIKELEKNITKNTKVIIVQHTFGKPAYIVQIMKLAKENNILVIEDCALSLGSRVNGKKLGSFGDFSIFSTGRDKVISSVTGGFLIINNKKYFDKVEAIEKQLKMPPRWLTIKNLHYNIIAYLAYKLYNIFKIGKILIYLSRKCNIITEILTHSEKYCNFDNFNYKLPNSLASLASIELQKIKFISTHRNAIAEYYNISLSNKNFKPLFTKLKSEKNNYFRYPIILKSEKIKDDLYNYMKKNNILLGNTWSGTNIVPIGSNINKANYIDGSCPTAEKISKKILTLPNHNLISEVDTLKIAELLNNY